MPNVYGTPQLWLLRAREAREMADNISDLEARQCMLDIAGNYEKIAAPARILYCPLARLLRGRTLSMLALRLTFALRTTAFAALFVPSLTVAQGQVPADPAPTLKLFHLVSTSAPHPAAHVTVPPGYKLVGGGARVNWSGAGNLLTASYPD